MKVLFAVNNDNVVETIVKKYQKDYKEILSYKNVYYFNAILRELQKDKSYSRVVISEDLEPFANNNYVSIDKFLLEKYSNVAEEAKSINNEKIDIILICADRRKKTDSIIVNIYKKEIYNAILGQDRSVDEVCKLIYSPRDKEKARTYYGIQESELGDTESETSVSEAEVENIRAHYARLGKNEDKYLESFNNIVAQYTDTQLKIIIKYLPMNVKAVLEERSPKYQELVLGGGMSDINVKRKTSNYKQQLQNTKLQQRKEEKTTNEDDVLEQLIKPRNMKDVVVPTNLKMENVQKVAIPNIKKPEIEPMDLVSSNMRNVKGKDLFEETMQAVDTERAKEILLEQNEENDEQIDDKIQEPQNIDVEIQNVAVEPQNNLEETNTEQEIPQPQKRGRGRPRKNPLPVQQEDKPKRGRGRPRKTTLTEYTAVQDIQNQAEETVEESAEEKQTEVIPQVDEQILTTRNIPQIEVPEIGRESITENNNKEEVNLFELEDSDLQEEEEEVDLFNIQQEEQEEDLFNIQEEQNIRK